jgi:hypothetical protein
MQAVVYKMGDNADEIIWQVATAIFAADLCTGNGLAPQLQWVDTLNGFNQ